MSMTQTLVIAEAGVNHNGKEDLALKLVEKAVSARADVVKFQTFRAEKLVTKSAPKANYQKVNTGTSESQFEMLKKLELSREFYKELLSYCRKLDIEFMSTAFDSGSLDFLVHELGVSRLKIPSGEITNGPLILDYAKTQLPIILSTGMSSLDDIECALKVLGYGILFPEKLPRSFAEIDDIFCAKETKEALRKRVTVLHCTTEYPTPIEDVNMRAMQTMKSTFNLPVGYSDHTEGIIVPLIAVACGAEVIEKHFTLDKKLVGPDHKASLDPAELSEMVSQIRLVEKTMGSNIKKMQLSEQGNCKIARRSLIAARDIIAGELFTAKDIDILRPGGGVSPMQYWDYLQKYSTHDIRAGDFIR